MTLADIHVAFKKHHALLKQGGDISWMQYKELEDEICGLLEADKQAKTAKKKATVASATVNTSPVVDAVKDVGAALGSEASDATADADILVARAPRTRRPRKKSVS